VVAACAEAGGKRGSCWMKLVVSHPERKKTRLGWGTQRNWLGDWAQVAERLMAADCKSATHSSYGGSNPPLCTIKTVVSEQWSVVRVRPGRFAQAGMN
jgi:hypothetical protein